MNSIRQILLSMLSIVLILTINIYSQPVDNIDPTVAQFPIVRGAGDPEFNGDLNVSIPLLTVPGVNGLNFDIVLQYIHGNGVPISESASWVGLGWNLNMYQISCNPVHNNYFEPSYYFYEGDDGTDYVPDMYFLSYPKGSTAFWLDENDVGIPQKWSAIKIEAIRDVQNNNILESFVVTGIDGTKYIFAEKLLRASALGLINHTGVPQTISGGQNYYYTFKLTAILAADYVDVNNNSIPDAGDTGAWLKLEYDGNTFFGLQINYLSSVISPTHTAEFILSQSDTNPYIRPGNTSVDYLYSLEEIRLHRNDDNTILKSIVFTQSNFFQWLYQTGGYSGESSWGAINLSMKRKRLESVEIRGKEGLIAMPPYEFEYYDGVVDEPGEEVAIDFDENLHNFYHRDNWGYLSDDPDETHPYSFHTYGMLQKIEYPTGGTATFRYESDYFLAEKYNFRTTGTNSDPRIMAGGLRLKEQIITYPDNPAEQIYTYEYGKTNLYARSLFTNPDNDPGYGFVSMDPGYSDRIDYITFGSYLKNDVHYPDVTIIQPDQSKITKYYTSSCTEVERTNTGNDFYWMFYDASGSDRIAYINQLSALPDYYWGYPYLRTLDEKCLQSNDYPYIEYWYYNAITYNYNTDLSWVLSSSYNTKMQEIFKCEASEFDDCQTFTLKYNPGIDNSWKRGYPVREEKYSSADELVWSKDYYYNMDLMSANNYRVLEVENSMYYKHNYTICSGWVRVFKTIENIY